MNTFLERLRKIPARFLEFWNKYSPVQRILMITVGVGVFSCNHFGILFCYKTGNANTGKSRENFGDS